MNILSGASMVSVAMTQGIGQGVSEALFLRSMLLEAKLAKKVNVIAHTDSTAGKSMATRFGTGNENKARGTAVPVCAESGANGFAANGKD